jgi:hypothetical protein
MPLWPLRADCVCVSFPTSVLPLQMARLWTLITRRRLLNFSPMLLDVTFLMEASCHLDVFCSSAPPAAVNSASTVPRFLCCCSLAYVFFLFFQHLLLDLSHRLLLSLLQFTADADCRRLTLSLSPAAQGVEPVFLRMSVWPLCVARCRCGLCVLTVCVAFPMDVVPLQMARLWACAPICQNVG